MLDVRLAKVERLHALESGNDEARCASLHRAPCVCELRAAQALTPAARTRQAYLSLAINADLTTAFSWNTKLLFVYLAAEYATPFNELNQARGAVARWRRCAVTQMHLCPCALA